MDVIPMMTELHEIEPYNDDEDVKRSSDDDYNIE